MTKIILSNKIETFLLHWQWPHDLYPLSRFPIIQSHSFVSQNTLWNAGGLGFYIRNDLTFTVLSECLCTTADYEAPWNEKQNGHGHNIICGVICRNPNDNSDSFLQYLNSTIECIDQGSKYCMCIFWQL